MVFKGEMADGTRAPGFEIKPQVVYPMEEGTALITFEEEQGTFDLQETGAPGGKPQHKTHTFKDK